MATAKEQVVDKMLMEAPQPEVQEQPEIETRTYKITGPPETLDEIECIFSFLNAIRKKGASADAEVSVDGEAIPDLKVMKIVGKGEELAMKSKPLAKDSPELKVAIEGAFGRVANILLEDRSGATATLIVEVGVDWDELRIHAWLNREGWTARGIRLDGSKSIELEGDKDRDTLMTLTGPRDAIELLQAAHGGRVVVRSSE